MCEGCPFATSWPAYAIFCLWKVANLPVVRWLGFWFILSSSLLQLLGLLTIWISSFEKHLFLLFAPPTSFHWQGLQHSRLVSLLRCSSCPICEWMHVSVGVCMRAHVCLYACMEARNQSGVIFISLCIIFRGLSVCFWLILSARLAGQQWHLLMFVSYSPFSGTEITWVSQLLSSFPQLDRGQQWHLPMSVSYPPPFKYRDHMSVPVAWISHECWWSELSFLCLLYPLSRLHSPPFADLKNNALQCILIISVMGFSMTVTCLWAMNFDLTHPHLLCILPCGFASSSQIVHSLFLSVSVCLASRFCVWEKSSVICLSGPGLFA